MKNILLVTLATFALAASNAQTAEWTIDKNHSTIAFSVTHMMVSTVRGSFTDWEASLNFDPDRPDQITAAATIQAASINTMNERRDNHLRSADFFEVETHPTITFKATHAESLGEHRYRVTGDITMRGVTKPITLEGTGFAALIQNPWGQTVTSASLKGIINREDFGLTWNKALESGGVLVSKDVTLEIDLELVKKEDSGS